MATEKKYRYADYALEQLCASRRQDFHDNDIVPVYTADWLRMDVNTYTRCNKSGWFLEYRHADNGRCSISLTAVYPMNRLFK